MRIDTDYFWFQLFKTRGIGAKTLAAVAKILAAENLNPKTLSLNQAQSPKLAKILKDKILVEDREVPEQCDTFIQKGRDQYYLSGLPRFSAAAP